MALTGWVEPDQVVWRGIRWARRGNLLVKYGEIAYGTLLIYTVPAGRTFYLVGSVLSSAKINYGNGQAWIRNASDACWFRLGDMMYISGAVFATGVFTPAAPLEVPEGYDFVVRSSDPDLTLSLSFFGWEE